MSYIDKIQINKSNKLAGLYPATKLIVVFLYSFSTLIIDSIKLTSAGLSLLLIPWFFMVLLLCGLSGEFKKCIKALKAVFYLSLIIFSVQTFIVPGGEVLWQYGVFKIHQIGLSTAVSLSMMIMNIAGIFVWLFQTTTNKEIAAALDDSGMNYKVAYVFVSTLQMIEILGKNSKTIMNAQKARGVETEGNLIIRAKAFFPSLVPLILGAVIGSEERVLTLEARGFSVQGKKTHLFKLKKSGIEKQVVVVSLILTILCVVGRIVLWIL